MAAFIGSRTEADLRQAFATATLAWPPRRLQGAGEGNARAHPVPPEHARHAGVYAHCDVRAAGLNPSAGDPDPLEHQEVKDVMMASSEGGWKDRQLAVGHEAVQAVSRHSIVRGSITAEHRYVLKSLVPGEGFEPPTFGLQNLSVRSSQADTERRVNQNLTFYQCYAAGLTTWLRHAASRASHEEESASSPRRNALMSRNGNVGLIADSAGELRLGAVNLTDRTVAALTCPVGRKDALFFDTALKGFGLRVTTGGARVFLYQYRFGPRVRRQVLGDWPNITAAQGRRLAEQMRGSVRAGADPVAQRKAAHIAALAAEAETQRAAAATAFTLRRLIDEWDRRHLAGMRASYRRDAMGRLRLHLAAMLDRPAATITRTESVQQLDRISVEAGETTARRVMGYGRSAYEWARKREMLEVNPFDGLPPMGRDIPRDRVLSDEELRKIWRTAADLGPVHGGFVRFLLLTLARRDEVAQMKWEEVAQDLSIWKLPAERSKNRKGHVFHLAAPARSILASLPTRGAAETVFATSGGRRLSTFSYIARTIVQRSDTFGWRFHDFRRTGVTWLATNGVAPHVADRLLNHVQGTISGVAAIYQRSEFMAERKAALEAWAAHVDCVAG
jgi:integrase